MGTVRPSASRYVPATRPPHRMEVVAIFVAPPACTRLLITHGYELLPVLDAIRKARPIAAILYAEDAVNHWLAVESDLVKRNARQTV